MAKAKTEVEKVSKTQLVVDAIAAIGGDPGPKEIQEYIKQHHNVDLKYALVASYKSNLKNKKGGGGARRGGTSQVSLNDLMALKELVDRVGEGRIPDMIQTLKALRK